MFEIINLLSEVILVVDFWFIFLYIVPFKILKPHAEDQLRNKEASIGIDEKWERRKKESDEADERITFFIFYEDTCKSYVNRGFLIQAGISEKDFKRKMNGNRTIYNALKSGTLHRRSDGRVYINDQELLEVLGLD